VVRRRWRNLRGRLICALGVVVSVGLLLPSLAYALEHPFLGNLGEANEPSFEEAQGMAVDQVTGDLLVIDRMTETLSRWHSNGAPSGFLGQGGDNVITGFDFGNFTNAGEVQVAVDNSGGSTDGNIYVPEAGGGVVDVFDKDGSPLGQLSESSEGPFEEPCGVAVDPSGNIYVSDFSGKIHKYEPAASSPVNGDNTANLSFSSNCTLAAGASATDGFIFPVHFEEGIAKLESSTPGAERYLVDPGPTTTATVNPATGVLYTASGSEVREFDASGEAEAVPGLPIGAGGEKVEGIAVDAETGNIYIARGGNPHIEVWGPAAQLPIAITESASVVGGTVTLHGTVNANEGPEATCKFQYAEVKAFKEKGFKEAQTAPCIPEGPFNGSASKSVSAQLTGLPEAAFRYRLLASNKDGSKAGKALVFSTFEEIGLPDGRTYEMVSPPQKAGEVIPPEPVGSLGGSCVDCLPGGNFAVMPMQSTPEGESVLYLGQPFFANLSSSANEYLSRRTSSGWGIETLSSPPMTEQFVAFSRDLSRGILSQADPTLSPQAPTRGDKGFANLYLVQGDSLEPLITTEPPNRSPGDFRVSYANANVGTALRPAFGHVLFEANDALTGAHPGIAPPALEVEGGGCSFLGAECNLYEWESGELRLVNVLPKNATAASGATIGSGRLLVTASDPRLESPNTDHAISEDGSRLFWSSEDTGHVYVRIEGKETLEIPSPPSCKESILPKERVCFLTASPDGSTVLLSDGKIYELNEAGTAYEESADLSEGKGGFEGILGAATDLSRVYFIDTDVLDEIANENEEEAEVGKFNLYAWDEGEIGFIGRLVSGDNGFSTSGRYGAWKASRPNRTAQVSSDGRWLAFMSLASLTGYDNTIAGEGSCSGGSTCREVFVYSADSGTLTCASCNPTGEQPLGPSNLSLLRPDAPFPQPGNVSRNGSGRLFFESQDALSSRDTNGSIQDVYEWEPDGVGSCERVDGCIYLISSGQSPNDSMFMDSSDSGENAFFITRKQLLPRDENQQLDLYDARVGGGFEESGAAPCGGEACKGPIANPPVRPTFGTESSGPGNPKPKPQHCKAGFMKKHGKCVKKHKKKKRAR
jgi:hypothetical protein